MSKPTVAAVLSMKRAMLERLDVNSAVCGETQQMLDYNEFVVETNNKHLAYLV